MPLRVKNNLDFANEGALEERLVYDLEGIKDEVDPTAQDHEEFISVGALVV